MKKQDLVSILITFIVGFILGGYLYVTEFIPMLRSVGDEIPSAVEANTLTIIGEVYGGCRDTCPSFRVLNDGSYRYLFTPGLGEEQIIREGVLPRALQRDLGSALTPQALQQQAQPIEPAICNSYTDGIDIRYRITYNEVQYNLNSCGTAVDGGSALWQGLAKIWNYFETGQ